MEKSEQKYESAKEIAKNKVAFIRHFIFYIFILIVLAIINNVRPHERQWWLWVALFWGIAVCLNFLKAYIFKGGKLKRLEEDLTKKEMERMKDEK